MTTIYYRFEPDRIVEVLNPGRHDGDDALFGRDLPPEERAHYTAMKAEGHGDTSIFETLQHQQSNAHDWPNRISVPIQILSREQLAWLIGERLGHRIRGLAALKRDDLMRLYASLLRRPQPRAGASAT